ncbi:MAG: DUF952 domain-containing protein, partial [Ilumatobacteraceae bacterium]
ARWRQSMHDGTHTGSTRDAELADVGFIHCSTAAQWPGVVERYYADAAELCLLHVDESLLASPLVWEPVGNAGELFPHVFGPIDLAAVVQVERIRG